MENPRAFWFPVLMGWRSGWTVALAGAALALLPSSASADRAFALRFSTNQATALAGAANSLMSCPDVAPACAAGRAGTGGSSADDDNDFAMTYIDVDADPTTFDSSSGRADIPPGATVLFAGLYWGADRSAGSPGGRAAINAQALGTVRLRAPADTAYRTVTADTLDTIGTRYQGFADVTAIVGAAGAGEYTIANVQAGTGPDRYAGWTLAVVVSDPSQPVRAVSIFDGFQQVSTAQPNVSIPVTGFTTRRRAGARRSASALPPATTRPSSTPPRTASCSVWEAARARPRAAASPPERPRPCASACGSTPLSRRGLRS